jgi:hypothetical protein
MTTSLDNGFEGYVIEGYVIGGDGAGRPADFGVAMRAARVDEEVHFLTVDIPDWVAADVSIRAPGKGATGRAARSGWCMLSGGLGVEGLLMSDDNASRVSNASRLEELRTAAMPLVEWLRVHGNPHKTVLVTQTSVEVVEGVMAFQIPDPED